MNDRIPFIFQNGITQYYWISLKKWCGLAFSLLTCLLLYKCSTECSLPEQWEIHWKALYFYWDKNSAQCWKTLLLWPGVVIVQKEAQGNDCTSEDYCSPESISRVFYSGIFCSNEYLSILTDYKSNNAGRKWEWRIAKGKRFVRVSMFWGTVIHGRMQVIIPCSRKLPESINNKFHILSSWSLPVRIWSQQYLTLTSDVWVTLLQDLFSVLLLY